MEINFTKQQFEALFKLTQYGYWIASDTQNSEEFSEMEQYINSFAKAFGLEGIEYAEEYGIYDLTRSKEEEIHTVIESFEEGVFRDKLAYYLARNEFAGNPDHAALSQEEAFKRLMELEEKYHGRIEEQGIAQLKMEE